MWHHAITLQPALRLCGRHVREFDDVEKYFSTPPEIKNQVVLSAKILRCNDLSRKVSQFEVEADY